MNPEVKCDLDVTNTSNVKDVQNYKPKKLQKISLAAINERKQPFGCDICKTCFSSKSDLVSHIEYAHSEEDLNEKPNENKLVHEQYEKKRQFNKGISWDQSSALFVKIIFLLLIK